MAELLKNLFNEPFIDSLANQIERGYAPFPSSRFKELVFAEPWESLELKQRMRRVTESLTAALPQPYREALDILHRSLGQGAGLGYMVYPDFVELNGLDDPETSIPALAAFTPYSSSEFAVRPFIVRYPELMLDTLKRWATDPNEHVRRLASEGCRPRLPWGMALQAFKADPTPIIPILTLLKEDDSLYVRKSVANNLNDISKDHPDIVMEIAHKWVGRHPHTDWIIRHACRTLIKKCDPQALCFFGLGANASIRVDDLRLQQAEAHIGQAVSGSVRLVNGNEEPTMLRIELAVDFVKANGSLSRKLFKLSEKMFPPGMSELTFKQSFRQLTTRKHYPGEHRLAIIVNGEQLADVSLILKA
ncbi:MAG: alkylation repair protein [Paenibacillus sp.]|nr:alkylation repair protein [Paenibacillus sp.]